jgi:hypothetical protein
MRQPTRTACCEHYSCLQGAVEKWTVADVKAWGKLEAQLPKAVYKQLKANLVDGQVSI